MQILKFHIDGVCCASSLIKAQKAIKTVAGVTKVRIDLAHRLAHVEGEADPARVVTALTSAGFTASHANE